MASGRSHPEWASVEATVVSATQAGGAVNIGPPGMTSSVHFPWQVRVRFETGYGSAETEGQVHLRQGEQPIPGATLAIRYDPTDPQRFELDGGEDTSFGLAQAMGNPEIAGMPLGDFVRKAVFDPAGTRAHTNAYGQQQMAAMQEAMNTAYQQATAHWPQAPPDQAPAAPTQTAGAPPSGPPPGSPPPAPSQATPAPAPDSEGTLAEQLERLTALHASGALSDDEFAAAKQRLLG